MSTKLDILQLYNRLGFYFVHKHHVQLFPKLPALFLQHTLAEHWLDLWLKLIKIAIDLPQPNYYVKNIDDE